ncbi:hypothetical protein RRG08_019013 [Elysia crispata]|uniref:Uncharacterized protein n=1 Tax=Elysia crispata TaxID=231223 RepID=A0AAE1A5J9_9GAST|nr:hypothetical protein RRG08_019013 [Elysia crispata]
MVYPSIPAPCLATVRPLSHLGLRGPRYGESSQGRSESFSMLYDVNPAIKGSNCFLLESTVWPAEILPESDHKRELEDRYHHLAEPGLRAHEDSGYSITTHSAQPALSSRLISRATARSSQLPPAETIKSRCIFILSICLECYKENSPSSPFFDRIKDKD